MSVTNSQYVAGLGCNMVRNGNVPHVAKTGQDVLSILEFITTVELP